MYSFPEVPQASVILDAEILEAYRRDESHMLGPLPLAVGRGEPQGVNLQLFVASQTTPVLGLDSTRPLWLRTIRHGRPVRSGRYRNAT